jgi:hypothetical protein
LEKNMNRRNFLISLSISTLVGPQLAKAGQSSNWVLLGREMIGPGRSQIEFALLQGASRFNRIKLSATSSHVKIGWIETIATRGQATRHVVNQHVLPGGDSDVMDLPASSKKVRMSVSRMPKVKDGALVDIWGLAAT